MAAYWPINERVYEGGEGVFAYVIDVRQQCNSSFLQEDSYIAVLQGYCYLVIE